MSLKSKLIKNVQNVGNFFGEKVEDVKNSKVGQKITGVFADASDKIKKAQEESQAKKTEKKAAEESRSQDEKLKEQVKLDDELKNAIDAYNAVYTDLNNYGMDLFLQRERSVDLILHIEKLINSIANHPKSFDKDFEEIGMEKAHFKNECEYTTEELRAAKTSAISAGAGVAAGASIAFVAPTAAMWIATTFGVASTGTAISALSGAAATNAALAWLGGGALAAGGGGTVAGNALLAMCGPIGWSLAGATLLTSVVLFAAKKIKMEKQKKEELESVLTNTEKLKEAVAKLEVIHKETSLIRSRLDEQYSDSLALFGKDYLGIPEEDRIRLATIVNNTKSLAATLGKTIE